MSAPSIEQLRRERHAERQAAYRARRRRPLRDDDLERHTCGAWKLRDARCTFCITYDLRRELS